MKYDHIDKINDKMYFMVILPSIGNEIIKYIGVTFFEFLKVI